MRKLVANRPGAVLNLFDPEVGPLDIYGEPVERSKQRYPYSYSPFVTWRKAGTSGPSKHGVYTDRLFGWDCVKHDTLCQKHFGDKGQVWSARSPAAIEAFLREYLGNETLELQVILQGCNVASGFPFWTFHYQ